MEQPNFFQIPGWLRKEDSVTALHDEIKNYLTEIITLKHIREEQMKTITALRRENNHLKNLLKDLEGF